jgi:hypothetical protein
MEIVFNYTDLTDSDIKYICNAKYLKLTKEIIVYTNTRYVDDIEYYVKVKSIDYIGNTNIKDEFIFVINGVYLVNNPETGLSISINKLEFQYIKTFNSITIIDEETFNSKFVPIYKQITELYSNNT